MSILTTDEGCKYEGSGQNRTGGHPRPTFGNGPPQLAAV